MFIYDIHDERDAEEAQAREQDECRQELEVLEHEHEDYLKQLAREQDEWRENFTAWGPAAAIQLGEFEAEWEASLAASLPVRPASPILSPSGHPRKPW